MGKYLGLCATLLVNVLIMGVGVSLALIYIKRGWDPLVPKIWPAILLIYFELMIITGVALLFSSFSSPALSALLTFFVFIIGHFSADLKTLAGSSSNVAARFLFRALYYVLPNLSNYTVITPAAHGTVPDASAILLAIVYALVYCGVLLAAATLIFGRRNFK
jgi:ABC-type transport system involved in multi-copper enzyme maturation permease subunit